MEEHERILAELKATEAARMGGFATTAERNAAMAAEYRAGTNSVELAKKFAISRQRVWQILQRQNVEAHHRSRMSADEILDIIVAEQLGTLRSVGERVGMRPHNVRSRIRHHPRWPAIREQMRPWRRERTRQGLRKWAMETYRNLVQSLGRPASLEEMHGVSIFKQTLFRIYGTNYVRKFREDIGEVS